MIDLTGQTEILLLVDMDDETGVVTITFRNSADTVTLGELKTDQARFRPLVDALGVVGRSYRGNPAESNSYKMSLSLNDYRATVSFS